MSGIKTTTGLISGLNIGSIVDAIVNAERAPAARLESRLKDLQATQAGLGTLQAQLLSLSSASLSLSDRNTFTGLAIQNSDPAQFSVASKLNSLPGTYDLQSVQLATTHRVVSRGYSSPDAALNVAGQLVISRGGSLSRPVQLDLLNGGQGVRRGQIQLTDRSGATAKVDLRNAVTASDVVQAINASGVGVVASSQGGQFVLRDTTGQSGNLSVAEVNGGKAAADLGLVQSVAADTLTGADVLPVTSDFTINLLNDGNGLRQTTGVSDLSVNLADGSHVAVNLDGVATLGDVISKLNIAGAVGSKFSASLTNGRLVLTDNTTGSESFSVNNLSGSNAAEVFGLNAAASGNELTGKRLSAGLNSVLLRNLRGGQGIAQLGSIALTDRTGASATVDLSSAETLDDVLNGINTATASGNVRLKLQASLSDDGTGIVVRDTSGSTASNLIIADQSVGTTAANLGIAVNVSTSSIASGSLNLRRVNEATSLSTYSPRGTAVSNGGIQLTDSAGDTAVINITSDVKTIGDVLDRINAAGLPVTAQLSETGDGVELIDNSGGTGNFTVVDIGGKTAADLRLTSAAVTGGDGKPRINARQVAAVTVEAADSLSAIAAKINALGGTVRASVQATGAALNGFRLSLQSTTSGGAGQFRVTETGLNLGLATGQVGQDAVLRVGGNSPSATLLSSSANTFTNAVGGLNVTLLVAGTSSATVTASTDTAKIESALTGFVSSYNSYIGKVAELTDFDPTTQKRAALQGVNSPLALAARFSNLVNRRSGAANASIRTLADVGLRVSAGGKLTFDATKLESALNDHPDEVRALFSDTTNGFAKQFNKALDNASNTTNGTLTLETNSLKNTTDDLQKRITAFDDRLAIRRQRLEQQFSQMEATLSHLQSQQSSLTGLSSVLANLRGGTSS